MNMTRWLVVGISGTTCSGKTTLSKRLHETLKNSVLINQDTYFLPEDDPRHIQVPELNFFNNWEVLTSLDMNKMQCDMLKVLGTHGTGIANENGSTKQHNETRVLILEGFLLFAHKPLSDLCDFKYFVTLTKQQCWERRKNRIYEPTDVPNYFELVVWPEYERYLKEIKIDKMLYDDIKFIDGATNKDDIFIRVFNDIYKSL